jgi:hypothetical protein
MDADCTVEKYMTRSVRTVTRQTTVLIREIRFQFFPRSGRKMFVIVSRFDFFSFRRETDRLHPVVAALRVAGLSMGAPTSEIGPSHQIVVAAILPELGAKADIARTVVNARLQPSHTLLIDWPRSSGPATW